jgi:hypothetical protein
MPVENYKLRNKKAGMNYQNPMEPNLFSAKEAKPYKGGALSPIEFDVKDTRGLMDMPNERDKKLEDENREYEHYENIVQKLDERLVKRIGTQCKEWLNIDLESRSEWDSTIKKGIEALGVHIMDSDEGDAPFDGACMATHPLILEAAVKYQSKASAELLPASGPVKTQVLGMETEEKLQSANRVKGFMNYQTTKVMTEYYPNMEKLLFYQPLYGSAFKKNYWDQGLGRTISCFIPSDNFVINNNATSLEKARRYSEILPTISGAELKRKITNGEYIEPLEWRKLYGDNRQNNSPESFDITGDQSVGGNGTLYQTGPSQMADQVVGQVAMNNMYNKVFTLVEQHCYLALPEPFGAEGLTDPYIVTFLEDTGEVLAIRRNWRESDELTRKKRVWYSHYPYVPGFGFYGLGLFHLLGNFQLTLTSVIRSLVDAGQFANLQGGFKLKGMKIVGDNSAIAPGEWKDVEGAIQEISKAMFPVPYKEPSQTLFQLLQWLDQRAGNFADSTEQVLADSTNYGPVGTTTALLEASMKLFSAIHKRTHYSQEQDLKQLAELFYENLPEEYPYDVPGGRNYVLRTDFDPKVVAVMPVSDPNVTSNAHRLSLAQTQLQAAMQAPQIHNLKKVYRNFYLALGVEDVDAIVPPDMEAAPLSPMEDILAMSQGKPVKAFPGQDHKAHAEFKLVWLEDPLVGGKAPTMKQFVPLVLSNIREHQILQMQEQIQGAVNQAGQPGQLAPEVVAQIQAQAIAEVKKANEALAQMLGGNEPMQIIAQAEMLKAKTEAQRVAHVKVKDLADLSLRAQELDIDQFLAQVKGKEVGMSHQFEQFRNGLEAVRMGIENLKKEAEAGNEAEMGKIERQGAMQKNAMNTIQQASKLKQSAMDHSTKMKGTQAQQTLKLRHQYEQNQQKAKFQEEANRQKLEAQKQQAKLKAKSQTSKKPVSSN